MLTTSLFSKYFWSVFAKRNPNDKLGFLVHLRKNNPANKTYYDEHNHPVTTSVDGAQFMTGKKFFYKLQFFSLVLEAERFDQYVDETGVAARTTDELIKNIGKTCQCINSAGLKVSMVKCSFDQEILRF